MTIKDVTYLMKIKEGIKKINILNFFVDI